LESIDKIVTDGIVLARSGQALVNIDLAVNSTPSRLTRTGVASFLQNNKQDWLRITAQDDLVQITFCFALQIKQDRLINTFWNRWSQGHILNQM
jgi:hypothetical protein